MGQVNKKDDTYNIACHQTVLESRLVLVLCLVVIGGGVGVGVGVVRLEDAAAGAADELLEDKKLNFRTMVDNTPENEEASPAEHDEKRQRLAVLSCFRTCQ